DQDGDMDLIICNGDSFDNNFANRSHGVQWIENLGDMQFRFHRLLDLPGAYAAKAGDMDNDGDLDILVVANLPETVDPVSLQSSNPPSIVVLEQTELKNFATRILSRDAPRYTSLELGDFNNDGKMDFTIGASVISASMPIPRITVWSQK
ncbi:MAG TPA: VCBS repeat-containing protein, partial [Pirellula sp.]|nr:VCBS repeat-containing protein [Pirellula sp.]